MVRNRAAVAFLFVALLASGCGAARASIEDEAQVAYQRAKSAAISRGDLITEGPDYDRVKRISQRLIDSSVEMRADAARWNWDVSYIRSSQVNAYCLPGGKVVVLSGLVERLSLTDDELAAILGHEIGHVMLEHGKENYNQRQLAKVAVGVLGIIAAIAGAKHNVDPNAAFNATTGLGSLGAEFFALRPYGRERELDADRFGAEVAAIAGFDTAGAVSAQQKLATSGSPPEFLSTHPSSETRVQGLRAFVPTLAEKYAARRATPPQLATIASASYSSAADPPPAAVVSTAQAATLVATPTGLIDDTDPDAIIGPRAATLPSKYMFNGEQQAKAIGCAAPVATMTTRAATYERFSIKCSDGRAITVRCTADACEVI